MTYHEGDQLRTEAYRWAFRWLLILGVMFGMGFCSGRASAQDRIFANGLESEEGLGPCEHPLVQPEGWQATTKSWQQAWSSPDGSPQATFPQSVGFPVPIGASKGGYTVIPFVPQAGQAVAITWDTAQSNCPQGYCAPRPAITMALTISTCPGDFRMGNSLCAMQASGASLFWSTVGGSACPLTPGVTYYLNVMAADLTDGLQAGEHSCDDISPWTGQGCDVQAVHRPF